MRADKNLSPVGRLFIEMVRYKWAANNYSRRLDVDEVLRHPNWGQLLPDSREGKRRRFDIEAEKV